MDTFWMFFFVVVVLGILFFKAEFYRKGTFHEQFLGLSQAKAIQGFCAIAIIFHHMAQKTSAPWLNPQYVIHGLDPFVLVGYLLVGVFLFFSGYGLYKSYREKENYLKGFLGRRLGAILFVYVVTNLCFLYFSVTSPYTWYVYAIIYLYVCFFLAFRFCKNDKVAIALVAVSILAYCILCDRLALGGYWFNTAGLFLIGILVAANEKKVTGFLKKGYPFLLIAGMAALGVAFWGAERFNTISYMVNSETKFRQFQIAYISTQFVAAVLFVFVLLLVSLKVKFHNRILSFAGSMTLEIYLAHGLFVQMFGFSFVHDDLSPVYYIKNIPLYVLVVVSLGILSAWLLHFVWKGLCALHKKYWYVFERMGKDGKKILVVGLLIIVAIFAVLAVSQRMKAKERSEKVLAYEEKYIQKVDVDGKKMAAYVVGEGEDSIVMFRGRYDPCSSLTMRAMADSLAEYYRVVVLDPFGSGFSDGTEKERTAQNIIKEIHTALEEFSVNPPFILMSGDFSELYAQEFTNRYPGEVKAVIGIDNETASIWKKELDLQHLSVYEVAKMVRRDSVFNRIKAGFADLSGGKVFIWPLLKSRYNKCVGVEDLDVPYALFFEKYFGKESVDEMQRSIETYQRSECMKYPGHVKVIDICSNERIEQYSKLEIDLKACYEEICTNSNNHNVETIVNASRCIFYNPESIVKIIRRNLDAMV